MTGRIKMKIYPIFSRSLVACVIALVSSSAHAGVVVSGTRFILHAPAKSLNVAVKNTSKNSFLVKSAVVRDTGHELTGSTPMPSPGSAIPFVITPPLFVLGEGKSNQLRLECTNCEALPQDRESLYRLSISAIPGGKSAPNSVQVAIRSTFKLFYRPEGLEGNESTAYQKLKWERRGASVVVNNPTPYYVTLYKMKINNKSIVDAGMVPPFSSREQPWCPTSGPCSINWQTLDDFGGAKPSWHVVPGATVKLGEPLAK
jgi:P pilus assembly chaperone PapD